MTQPARPKVTLKLATSLDGRIATSTGESQWISSEASRKEVHALRAAHEAVLVGIGTVLADDPMLTVRHDPIPEKQPIRLIADSQLRTPLGAKVVETISEAQTILITGLDVEEDKERPFIAAGADVWAVPIAPLGGVSVQGLLARCAEAGITSIFLEGGGKLAASFLKADAVDHLEWFRAPIVIGGDGLPCFGGLGIDSLADVKKWERSALRESGSDLWESYVRRKDTE
jgi:diaminohydroxyphosphoribosylaminopyrimidine deaminase/5-amino-6-(5-phosphoribosylamino)uracil reductase